MKTREKTWKLKNKGFTLIEMIVTVAIIAIFSGVVVTFIGTGSSVYRSTSSSSKVQMETQETFDKIEDLIIDTNRSFYYAYGSGSEIGAQITNDIKEKVRRIKPLLPAMNMKTVMEKPVCIFMMYWTGRNQMERFIIAADNILPRAVMLQVRMTRQGTIQRISQMSQKKIL